MLEYSYLQRKTFKENDDIRDAGLTTPEGIKRFDDILYGDSPEWQILDVYRPRASGDEKLPVIINVHGGGWVYGDKERYQFYTMQLALRGFTVINYTYRLAPEYQYPAPLEDLNLVVEWMVENKEKYGFDLKNIFGVGDSAGAQILGTYACIKTNPEFAGEFTFKIPKELNFRALALNCGLYRFAMDNPEDITLKLLHEAYLPEGGSKKELELISVANHVTEDFPPVFVMTAIDDFVKAFAPYLIRKLEEYEVEFVYRMYGNRKNRLEHDFQCNVKLKDAAKCMDDECGFFKGFITNQQQG